MSSKPTRARRLMPASESEMVRVPGNDDDRDHDMLDEAEDDSPRDGRNVVLVVAASGHL